MKKNINLELLFNENTGNIIISHGNSSVTLPESLHKSLHAFLMEKSGLNKELSNKKSSSERLMELLNTF